METFQLKEDLKVFGFPVNTFPNGIGEAFDTLVGMIPGGFDRPYYGIAYMNHEGMVYLATALEKYPGESTQHKCKQYTIEKGNYLVVVVSNWRTKTDLIKDVFNVMLQNESSDRTKPCIEWYKNDEEMLCMVKSKSTEQ